MNSSGIRRLLRIRHAGQKRSEMLIKYGLVVVESHPTIKRVPRQAPMSHTAENTRTRIVVPGLETTDIIIYAEPEGNRRNKKTDAAPAGARGPPGQS